MSGEFLERNLKRLLDAAGPDPVASPAFRERLRHRLHGEADAMRGAATPFPEAASRGAPHAGSRRVPAWRIAAAAAIVVLAAGLGYRFLERPRPSEPGRIVCRAAPAALRVPAGRPIAMAIPEGARGSVVIEDRGVELARLHLEDGAAVDLGPGREPVLALRNGLVRVEALRALRVRVDPIEVLVGAGADVEVERIHRTGDVMNKSWLVPGGIGIAVGAAAVAILSHLGDVKVKEPASPPTAVAPERPLVIQVPATRPIADDDRDRRLAQAERRIADLEKKLAAAKKESDQFAAELVRKKGVTIDSITAKLAELKKKPGSAMLPGATNDLIADLKGMGPAGVQALIDLLKSDDPKDRLLAAKLLEELKDPSAITALRDVALNDTDSMAAIMAGHAIAIMSDPGSADVMKEILASKRSEASVINSLWGLVNIGDAQGMDQAVAYMNDAKIDDNARAALGANVAYLMTDRPDVMPIVDATVRDFYTSARVMSIAVDYYRAIGTPDARQRLQAIADDARLAESVRSAARDALAH